MKFYKTIILAILAVIFSGGVYYFTIVNASKTDNQVIQIVNLQKDQINYLELQNKNIKFVFQKTDLGWNIEEPISDIADDQRIDEVLTQLTNDKEIAVAKEGALIDWAEFGLDTPEATVVIKNNLGQSQKISISETKNFEGNHYARVDNLDKIIVVNPAWYSLTKEPLTFYREKSLYRGQIAALKKVSIKSLNDTFSLMKDENGWYSLTLNHADLDQVKVQAMIKSIAENTIQDYISEGDPSDLERKEKGLNKDFVEVVFETADRKWTVVVNLNEKDKALYALTDKPTYLVKLDVSQWELFGNLNLDSLRDRKSTMSFNIDRVGRVFIKSGFKSLQLVKENSAWVPEAIDKDGKQKHISVKTELVDDLINQVHNLEITYFLPETEGKNFTGQDMIILKTAEDQLLYQLNWGPLRHQKQNGLDKDYYLSRTQASDNIFGMNKSYIDQLPLEKLLADIEAVTPSQDKARKK